ncbi:glutaredoxin family protein [Luteococcus peritonei]
MLLTRQGCHLCELALPVVERLAGAHGARLAQLDVDADEALRARYTDHVPVLFVRGRLVDYWQVREDRLEAALAGQPVSPPAAL